MQNLKSFARGEILTSEGVLLFDVGYSRGALDVTHGDKRRENRKCKKSVKGVLAA